MRPNRHQGAESWETEEQLLRAAWYYYVDQLTQDETAKKLSISRASAGRLLERCRQSGIVSFTINSDHYESFHIARRLREAFGLREALVPPQLDADSQEQSVVNARLGRGGAQYLQDHLKPGDTFGIGWGDTVQHTVRSISTDVLSKVSTVTLTGGVGAYLDTLRRVGSERRSALSGSVLPTPIVASTESLAEALRAEHAVQSVLEVARGADHALVGIGGVARETTLAQLGYADPETMELCVRAGAVGDILGVFYDDQGEIVDLPLHRRRIGIELSDLKTIPNVVAVAGGMNKLEAIRGALRGGLIDVLVTTENVALALLEDEKGSS